MLIYIANHFYISAFIFIYYIFDFIFLSYTYFDTDNKTIFNNF